MSGKNKLVLAASLLVLFVQTAGKVIANDDMLVYSDRLNNGWANWGYNATLIFTNTLPVHSGSNSISASMPGYSKIWLIHDNIDTSIYNSFSFWVNGGVTGGQQLKVAASTNSVDGNWVSIGPLPTNSWQQVTVSFASLGIAYATNLNYLWINNWTGNTLPLFYLDDLRLVAAPAPVIVHVGINTTNSVRTVNANIFGINQVAWDSNVYSPMSVSIMNDLGNPCLRWPGGSWGDDYHWTNEPWMTGATSARNWGSFSTNFMQLATNTHAQAFIICNYGSSDANEAAFGVRMFNVTNHCNFKYWEIGNEVGGGWETDNNTNAPWQPHDPWTYAMRFTNYYALMKAVDPTIKIGAVADITEDGTSNYTNHPVVNPRTGVAHNGWTPVMLTYLRSNNVTPDFLIEHKYPPSDGDTYNLLWSKTWSSDVACLRQMVNDYLGSTGTNVTLECSENGSTGDAQSVSLVGGLLYADSIGQVLQTEMNSRIWWDARNGGSSITDPDNALYGWRTNSTGFFYQDGGIVYNAGTPTNRYPKYYVAKLLTHFASGGDTVVMVTNDYELLGTYAVRRTNGTLTLLVINKSASSNLTAAVNIAGYLPASNAIVFSYGIPQDTAALTSIGSTDIQTNSQGVATNFTSTFAPYSASVILFTPAPPILTGSEVVAGNFIFLIQGQLGTTYVLQNSTNLNSGWISVATNTLVASPQTITNNISGAQQYWRAFWQL